VDKFVAMVDITRPIFSGQGGISGQRGELGGNITNFELSYRDPWFMDKPFHSLWMLHDEERLSRLRKKGDRRRFGFGKSFGEYWGANIMYNFEKAEVFGVSDTASTIIKSQEA